MRTRIGRTLDRIDAALGRIDVDLEAIHEELEANRRERAEMREFMRELNLRSERTFQSVVAELKDMGDQIRANTAATWAMVDEIRGTSR
jgi:uncharacterized membrane protein